MKRNEPPRNVAASIRHRLLNLARERGEPFDLILTRYGIERLLYRLSRSRYQGEFVLKGAMLFQVWTDAPHRATRDLDLLGRGDSSIERLTVVFRETCTQEVEEDDGLVFEADTVHGVEIRENQEYGGIRLTFSANLAGARIPIQIDIGFGDAVTAGPLTIEFPTLLNQPAPVLPAYSRETVVAEKYQALVMLGIANTRMKDFFDLWVLGEEFAFDGTTFAEAIRATFLRRVTPLPDQVPIGLSDEFAAERVKQAQWSAFLKRGKLEGVPGNLGAVVVRLRHFLIPPTAAVRAGEAFQLTWHPSGPWSPRGS